MYISNGAEWSSLVARRAHNPKVGGSNPPSATKGIVHNRMVVDFFYFLKLLLKKQSSSFDEL